MQNLKNYWNKFKYILLLASILFSPVFTYNSYSDNLQQGDKIIEEMIAEAQKHALETIELSSEERSKKITPLINKYINLDFMAKATTGSFWKKATDDQKIKFKLVLLHQIVNTIEEHLNTLVTMSYKPLSSELRGKKLVYVRGIIEDRKKSNPPINLLWKLSKGKDKTFSILDLEIEGISLIRSHKSETTSILRKNKGNFDFLIEKLKIKK